MFCIVFISYPKKEVNNYDIVVLLISASKIVTLKKNIVINLKNRLAVMAISHKTRRYRA